MQSKRITEFVFGSERSRRSTLLNGVAATTGIFILFQLYPHHNPTSGIPEIHISWLILLMLTSRLFLSLSRIRSFLLSPRAISLYSILPISYSERLEAADLFWQRINRETILLGYASAAAGISISLLIPTSKLLSPETVLTLSAPLLVLFIELLFKAVSQRSERFLSAKDPRALSLRNISGLQSMKVQFSKKALDFTSIITKPIKSPSIRAALRHQIHTLIHDSKQLLLLIIIGLPTASLFLMKWFPEFFQNRVTATLVASFATITFFLTEPLQHSYKSLRTIPAYYLKPTDIVLGNHYLTFFLWFPMFIVFLVAVNHHSFLHTLIQMISLFLAFTAMLLWNRILLLTSDNSMQGLQLLLLWVFCIILDSGVSKLLV